MIVSRRPTELAGRSAIGGAGGIRGDHIALYDMGAPIVLFPELPQVRANGGIAGDRGRGIASPDLAGYLAELVIRRDLDAVYFVRPQVAARPAKLNRVSAGKLGPGDRDQECRDRNRIDPAWNWRRRCGRSGRWCLDSGGRNRRG